jgi:hypothetical protein
VGVRVLFDALPHAFEILYEVDEGAQKLVA